VDLEAGHFFSLAVVEVGHSEERRRGKKRRRFEVIWPAARRLLKDELKSLAGSADIFNDEVAVCTEKLALLHFCQPLSFVASPQLGLRVFVMPLQGTGRAFPITDITPASEFDIGHPVEKFPIGVASVLSMPSNILGIVHAFGVAFRGPGLPFGSLVTKTIVKATFLSIFGRHLKVLSYVAVGR
jgi:hypothetical protein